MIKEGILEHWEGKMKTERIKIQVNTIHYPSHLCCYHCYEQMGPTGRAVCGPVTWKA